MDRDYYLVPWQSAQGIVLIVQVDAKTGSMSGAAPVNLPQYRLVLPEHEALGIASGKSARPLIGEPTLVWRPCRESSSPFQPFYRMATQGGECFVGAGGAFYPALTPFGQGG